MAVIKNEKTGCWEVRTYYKDILGNRKQKTKRGFAKKSEALDWERSFKLQQDNDLNMSFEDFYKIYLEDISARIKENSTNSKVIVVEKKILPFFGKKPINSIKPADVRKWQTELLNMRKPNGEKYSPTYIKTIHAQLSAIFNHAVNFYGLSSNPARKAGCIGKEESKEMLFWTQDEYQQFIEQIADKPQFYYAFEMLYWTGIRCGELLALTTEDIDFENKKLRINKSYQRIKGKDVITDPKTRKSNRMIIMPDFLIEEMEEYTKGLYGYKPDDRIFQISKTSLHNELKRGVQLAGVKKIRVHDLRHSHVSLLIQLGYSALAIAERVGHEAVKITYRYAHLFPTVQTEMADKLSMERAGMINVKKE
jgi:integrase